jgi:hypothetical protein
MKPLMYDIGSFGKCVIMVEAHLVILHSVYYTSFDYKAIAV